MLTARNVLLNGDEDVVEVNWIRKEHQDNPQPGDNKNGEVITGSLQNGNLVVFTQGNVYVMNNNGKTVASYSLMAD